jgi:hypothetical protein
LQPFFHGEDSESEEDAEDSHDLLDVDELRPLLLHTKSNNYISSRMKAFRRGLPATVDLVWAITAIFRTGLHIGRDIEQYIDLNR